MPKNESPVFVMARKETHQVRCFPCIWQTVSISGILYGGLNITGIIPDHCYMCPQKKNEMRGKKNISLGKPSIIAHPRYLRGANNTIKSLKRFMVLLFLSWRPTELWETNSYCFRLPSMNTLWYLMEGSYRKVMISEDSRYLVSE